MEMLHDNTNTGYITIGADLFEHILNCLANQKYMPTLHNQSLREHDLQQVIDKAWNEGMEILTKSDKNKNIRIIKQ